MAKTTALPERTYLSTTELDSLARMHTEMMAELWILRDRVLVLEQLLTDSGVLKADHVDRYTPGPDLTRKLNADRDRMVARIVGAGHRKSLDEVVKSGKRAA
ncbi:MAG TPA: hypothetical protein P5528_09055 [Steroidobacteraceae bacterium]|nr:hypothetical protein [Steroidobacteraceae bacterium]HRX89580.1 hypothetical protein [Steroidobacteraceae bacterium]